MVAPMLGGQLGGGERDEGCGGECGMRGEGGSEGVGERGAREAMFSLIEASVGRSTRDPVSAWRGSGDRIKIALERSGRGGG